MKIKVAVIIPTYMPKEYLQNCFLSLENQTLSKDDFCVYICLNGQKDPYEQYVLESLSKTTFHYKYIYNEEKGVSKARNTLLDIAEAEYIVFMDDDDLISENYLDNLLKVSNKKYMSISNSYAFEKNIKYQLKNTFMTKTFFRLKETECSKFRTRKFMSSPVAKMLHFESIADIRFDEKVAKGEDSLFMATISKNIIGCRKTTVDTCYYVYERQGSVTRSKMDFKKDFKNHIYLIKKYIILLYDKEYNAPFILTRIVATIRRIFYLFLGKNI